MVEGDWLSDAGDAGSYKVLASYSLGQCLSSLHWTRQSSGFSGQNIQALFFMGKTARDC